MLVGNLLESVSKGFLLLISLCCDACICYLDWPQSLMSIFSKTDNLSKIAIYKLYLEVEVLGLDIRDW